MRILLDDVIKAVNARLCTGDSMNPEQCVLDSYCTDNREARAGSLFFCLRGQRTDGHRYAAAAVQAGAVAVVAEEDPFAGQIPSGTALLLVDDSLAALGQLARFARQAFRGGVIGVSGSAGKTTFKELLATMLSLRGKTGKTPHNFNTQVGMSLSILSFDGDEDYWILEAGISQAHDMDELGAILGPDLAVLINADVAHAEGLGERGVAAHKARLLNYVTPGGMALVSADYPDLVKESRLINPATVYFSVRGTQVPYRASYLGLDGNGRGLYRLWLDGVSLDVTSALTGTHGAETIIAAAAAAQLMGATTESIAQAIETSPPPSGRFSRLTVPGWTVVDDSYNANPLSCARVVEAASELAREKDLVLVLGEMRELGSLAEDKHRELGQNLAASRAKAIFWKGGHAEAVREGLQKGYYQGLFKVTQDVADFMNRFQEWDQARKDNREGVILFKASRGTHIEVLLEAFLFIHRTEGEPRGEEGARHVV